MVSEILIVKEYTLNYRGLIIIWFKVYSLIKGYWDLWGLGAQTRRGLSPGVQQRASHTVAEPCENQKLVKLSELLQCIVL